MMILPDVNLLLYAYNSGAPHHEAAREWWEQTMSGGRAVGLPWAVMLGFVRIGTHPRVLSPPMAYRDAVHHVQTWLARPRVSILEPGPRHLVLLEQMLDSAGVAGALTSDAHLAALAMEFRCELHSNDADFARFPGLRWHNPLVKAE